MIPADVEQFTTAGEGRFYRFLEAAAKPDHKYISWYAPNVEGMMPDFVLFSEESGLIVFEVKDWDIGQIAGADPYRFELVKGRRKVSVSNPLAQARRYQYAIIEKISHDGRLVEQANRDYLGKIKVPVSHGVILPNITRDQLLDAQLDRVLEVEKILFSDDLQPQSDWYVDPSGRRFHRLISAKFPPLFPCRLTGPERDYLRQLIFPKVKIDLPARQGPATYLERRKQLKVLDCNQEALARQFNGGHRLIKGPSGTGKTIILVHKAALFKQSDAGINRILFVCFNLALRNYIRRLLTAKQVALGEGGVEVCSFYELCGKILGESIDHANPDGQYFKTVIELTLQELKQCRLEYDAILVDEGQDFSDDMLRIVAGLLNRHSNNLTIAMDENQNLYRRTRSWKKLHIHVSGRHSHKLTYAYRHTVELTRFYNRFLGNSKPAAGPVTPQREMFPGFSDAHGPPPCLIQFPSIEDIITYIVGTIKRLTRKEMLPLAEVAVMYAPHSTGERHALHLPDQLSTAFTTHGIFFHWVSRDVRSKLDYDITTDSVTLSSIHSLKGFDYSCVFVLGLEQVGQEHWASRQLEQLAYVAITRARDRLYIPYLKKTPLIQKLVECR
jgi:hypothetical protein